MLKNVLTVAAGTAVLLAFPEIMSKYPSPFKSAEASDTGRTVLLNPVGIRIPEVVRPVQPVSRKIRPPTLEHADSPVVFVITEIPTPAGGFDAVPKLAIAMSGKPSRPGTMEFVA